MRRVIALAILTGLFVIPTLGCGDSRVGSTPTGTHPLPADPTPAGGGAPKAPSAQ